MQSQNLQNQSSTNQSNEQAYIKAQANDAVDLLWQFDVAVNYKLKKLNQIQGALQAVLFEKIGVSSPDCIDNRPAVMLNTLYRALENCQALQRDLHNEADELSDNDRIANIDAAMDALQEATISNIPTSNN